MSNVAIRAENLSKRYRIGTTQATGRSFRGALVHAITLPARNYRRLRGLSHFGRSGGDAPDILWALKDVSFEVAEGEVLGVVGRNGAGKSTLLKVLSRVTEPTCGSAVIRGRVGSLLEVGTGFHRELTGEENVYLSGAVLGMTRTEIKRKFDEIVAFAQVEEFIHTPAKRYSTGMLVRLAFAVAAHLEPEILLIDEVLAVGDTEFQRKCLGKMADIGRGGRTILFVSHNLGAVTRLCTSALWLENGHVKLSGSPAEIVAAYLSSNESSRSTWTHPASHCSTPEAQLSSLCLVSNEGEPTAVVPFREGFRLEISYDVVEAYANTSITCTVMDSLGNVVWRSLDTEGGGWNGARRPPGKYVSSCAVPGALLKPGRYTVSVGSGMKSAKLWRPQNPKQSTFTGSEHENVLAFDVSEVGFDLDLDRAGIVSPPLKWSVGRIGDLGDGGLSDDRAAGSSPRRTGPGKGTRTLKQ